MAVIVTAKKRIIESEYNEALNDGKEDFILDELDLARKVDILELISLPVISGTSDITHYVGDEAPDYLDGVTALDAQEGDITDRITVDDSEVILATPGEYDLIYTVLDSSGNDSSVTVTVTVTAVYTLTIETNGGTPVPDPIIIPEGADMMSYLPDNPTKEGYVFAGYHSDVELTQQYLFGVMPGNDLTLYIKWNQLFTVTYDLNGGNIEGVTDAIVVTDVPEGTLIGSAYGDNPAPVLADNTWTDPYWVTTAEGSTDAASTTVSADVTVYAYWV